MNCGRVSLIRNRKIKNGCCQTGGVHICGFTKDFLRIKTTKLKLKNRLSMTVRYCHNLLAYNFAAPMVLQKLSITAFSGDLTPPDKEYVIKILLSLADNFSTTIFKGALFPLPYETS